MAVSDAPQFSAVAGATFASTDVYKGLTLNSSGHAVLPDSTDVQGRIIGVLYAQTATTSAAGVEVVPYANGGLMKVRMAASTLSAGDSVGFSTAGLGIAPTTDAPTYGVIQYGSSGAAGRVVSIVKTGN